MLVLVVGPSGAGKDTLLGAAKTPLADDPRFRFARRIITRPAQPEREDYEAIDEQTFRARRDAGAFGLWWQAHGLHYGIPSAALCDLATGAVVVASVSRSVVAEAAALFPVRVVEVTASTDVLACRLASRGRNDQADMVERLARVLPLPDRLAVSTIVNDGTIEEGGRAMTALLIEVARETDRGFRSGS